MSLTVTAHQPNFLPGLSVIERIRRADVVIWLDCAQYVRHSFVNRNRLSDGDWMTVPVRESDTLAPINRVHIADPTGRARTKIARKLEHHFGEDAAPFARELRRPYQLLAGLNLALINRLFEALDIQVEQKRQSELDPLHAVPAWSTNEFDLMPVRERYADMAAQLGATTWLTGPGHRCGNVPRFTELGIEIETFGWDGPNPSAIELLRAPLKAAA